MKLLTLIFLYSFISIIIAKKFIINGRQATEGQFPSIVMLLAAENVNSSYRCGGTLISPTFVVTAAHCVVRTNTSRALRDPVLIYVGSTNIQKFNEIIGAKNVIVHENYDRIRGMESDIALIELKAPVSLGKNVELADLPHKPPTPGSLLTAVGWGLTEQNTTSEDLLYVTMPIPSDDECDRYVADLKDSVVCLFKATPEGTCSGDSGGPFYQKDSNTLIGITSFGYDDSEGKCDTTMPSVGTSVYYYLDWIKSHMTE